MYSRSVHPLNIPSWQLNTDKWALIYKSHLGWTKYRWLRASWTDRRFAASKTRRPSRWSIAGSGAEWNNSLKGTCWHDKLVHHYRIACWPRQTRGPRRDKMQATGTSTATSQASLTTHYLHFLPLGTQEHFRLFVPYMGNFFSLGRPQDVDDQRQLVNEGLWPYWGKNERFRSVTRCMVHVPLFSPKWHEDSNL